MIQYADTTTNIEYMRRYLLIKFSTSIASLVQAVVLCLIAAHANAITTLTVDESLQRINLSDKVEYYEDSSGLLTYEQVMALPEEKWHPYTQNVISLGFTGSDYWFRFRINCTATLKMEPIISVGNAHIETINLYNIIDGDVSQYVKAGSSIPFHQKADKHRHPVLPLKLDPTSESTIYLQARTDNAFQLPVELLSREEFLSGEQSILLFQGVYLGIRVIMLMCNLVLAVTFHQSQIRGLDGFVAFVFFFGIFQIALYGIGGSEFWSLWPDLFNVTSIYTIGFAMISACWCVTGLLELRKSNRLGLLFMLTLAGSAGLLMIAYPYIAFKHIIYLLHVLIVPTAIAALVLVSTAFIRGRRPAIWALGSWFLVMVTVLAMALSRLAWIPYHPLWNYSASILFICMVMVTTIIVVVTIARQRTGTLEDVLNYEKSARKDQMLLNKQLEHDFRNKTQDLSLALSKLSETNKTLLEISTSDSVTGIKNRHFFDDIYDIEWKRASRQGYSICLMMIDIDHFKKINDRYGHPVGDICLRDVADAIKRSLRRPSDVVARFGGEEFIVVLPYLSMENGQILGERIRAEVDSLMTITGGHMIQLTISVGVATAIPTDKSSPETLVQAADAALYRAKQEGRNRVCLADDPVPENL
jgi:diguanylate cyclase (GGDEF)-like protein